MRILKNLLLIVFTIIITMVLTLYLYKGFESRGMADLKKYHKEGLETSLYNYVNYISIHEYLEADKKYLKEVYNKFSETEKETYSKYNSKSISYPETKEGNLNSSFQLIPENNKKGAVLLIHGLSDSPYTQRDIAEIFYKKGYYVLCLRMPGHGTTPYDLIRYNAEDWYENVKFGIEKIEEEMKKVKDAEFIISGYSLGGTLSLRYILEALNNDKMKMPDKVIWFSPANGINKYIKYANIHKPISWIEHFEKLAWYEVEPEYDRYKTRSFPRTTGVEIAKIIENNNKIINKLTEENLNKLPPIYMFQTIVDGTLENDEVFKVFSKIEKKEKSKLFIFDVNKEYEMFFYENKYEKNIEKFILHYNIQSELNFITNNSTKFSDDVYEEKYILKDGSIKNIERNKIKDEWKEGEFSVSHLGMTISPENIYYGRNSLLGNKNIKGERNLHVFAREDYTRIRYNPFFDYMKQNIEEILD